MGRPRFAFLFTFACCVALAHAAVAGINLVGAEGISVAPKPNFMVAGDLNKDGQTDVVVIAPKSNEVDVFLGAGPPSYFAPARTLHFGSKLGRSTLGDLNGDGLLDLAVTDLNANTVWILIGKGDGTFLDPYQIAVPNGKSPNSVAIGNFDTFGYADLAVADAKLGLIFILRNDNGTPPRFLQGGQIDLGRQTGNTAPQDLDVRSVDLNNDGKLDLLVLNTGGQRVKELDSILWTGVTQGFPVFDPPQRFTIGVNPSSMVVADFDNNGLPDVAMLNQPSGGTGNSGIDVLLNTGNGVFNPPLAIPVNCPFFTAGQLCKSLLLAAGDFDGNGNVDLMVALTDPRHPSGATSLADAMQAFGGRGDGVFVPGGVFATQKAPLSMVTGDVTGDGKPDIAIANQTTLNMQAFVNVSTAGSTPDGDTCLLDEECLANRCTDGVCCADQCDVTNGEKCNVPGRAGTCVPIPAAPVTCTLPNPACAIGEFCVDGFCCDQSCPNGHCDRDGFQGVCIPGVANGQPCTGDNSECSSGFCSGNPNLPMVCCNSACTDGFCDQFGICHALSPNGVECQQNSDCQSDICDPYDAICCNAQCDSATEVCFPEQGECRPLTYTPMVGTPGYHTPTATPSATPRLTPVSPGMLCSTPTDCDNGNCVNGVCCQTSSCGTNEQCQVGTGVCVAVTPTPTATVQPTNTISPTPSDPTPTPDPCGDPSICPSGERCQVVNGAAACVSTSSSGGCSTAGDDPARGNLAVAALLPLALWSGRRWRLRRVRVRSRAPRQ